MRTRVCLLSIWIAAVGTWIHPATAEAYRPFDGTDADVAALGEFELELGPVGYYQIGQERNLVVPSLVLNYGLVPRVELVLQAFNYVGLGADTPPPLDRLVETELSAKIVLREGCLQDRPGLSVATELAVLLPQAGGESGVGSEAAAIVTQCFGPAFTVHYNGSVGVTRALNLDLFGGAILEGPKTWCVRPVAELFVEHESHVGDTFSALLGAIWTARDDLDFDVGLRFASASDVGLVGPSLGTSLEQNVYEVRAGLTLRIPIAEKG